MIVSDKLSLEITFKSSNIQEGEKAALFKVTHCFIWKIFYQNVIAKV